MTSSLIGKQAVIFGAGMSGLPAARTVLRRKCEMLSHEVDLHLQNFRATGTELIVGDGRFVK